DAYPRLDNITWPGWVPYYALSSGTTSGTTKYIPVTREMMASNKKAAYTTLAFFRHLFPAAKLFTGKFFFLGGSTDLRKQADGSLGGGPNGVAGKGIPSFPPPYTVPPFGLTPVGGWEQKGGGVAGVAPPAPATPQPGPPA